MNLDVVWKKLVIDADNGSIDLIASPDYINLATEVGLFIWFIYKEDTALLSDGTAFTFNKLLTDTPFASDAQVGGVPLVSLEDGGALATVQVDGPLLVVSETIAVTDLDVGQHQIAFGQNYAERFVGAL